MFAQLATVSQLQLLLCTLLRFGCVGGVGGDAQTFEQMIIMHEGEMRLSFRAAIIDVGKGQLVGSLEADDSSALVN